MDLIRRKAVRAGAVWLCLGAVAMLASCGARQDLSVSVAVAANFTAPAREIAELFRRTTGYAAVMSFGSTGLIFTQITQEAPFEVFLAADQETPRRVVAEGFGLEDSLMTYAIGKIVLFSSSLDLSRGEAVLGEGRFDRLAVANPSTAPYGAAAAEAMKALGLDEHLRGKLVQGNNIAQTFQFVETGNAELGFVALSQVAGRDPKSMWIVPETLYSPIRQDAVLLRKGVANEAARAFLEFLKSPDALAVIDKFGYADSP
jgi:molybdate transport system substrate-binding protein